MHLDGALLPKWGGGITWVEVGSQRGYSKRKPMKSFGKKFYHRPKAGLVFFRRWELHLQFFHQESEPSCWAHVSLPHKW